MTWGASDLIVSKVDKEEVTNRKIIFPGGRGRERLLPQYPAAKGTARVAHISHG